MPRKPIDPRWMACLGALAGGTVGVAAEPPRAMVETLDDRLVGRVVRLDSRGELVLSDDSFARLSAARVLAIRFDRADGAARGNDSIGSVELTDGTRLAYQIATPRDGVVRFRSAAGAVLDARVEQIEHWRLTHDAEGLELSAPESRSANDVIWVKSRRGDSITPVEGVVLGVMADALRFALPEGDVVEPPWRRLAAIRFYREAPPPSRTARIRLRDGSRLLTDRVRLDGPTLRWDSPGAPSGEAPIDAIAAIELQIDRVVPASKLTVLSSDWRTVLGDPAERVGLRFDQSLMGSPLSLRFPDRRAPNAWPRVANTKTFETGLAMRSGGELRFELPPNAKRLKGWIGINPATARSGSAIVTVLHGEAVAWSGVVDDASRPVELNEPLVDATTLTIEVDHGANLAAGDHVHFAELRVIR